MAIIHKDLQEWTAPAGESTVHLQNVYDDATGLQATVTAVSILNGHADWDLGGTPKLTAAVVGGRAQMTANCTALSGSFTPRWYVLRVTVGGVNYDQATGSNVYVVTKTTETITAPTTLAQDYPSSGNNTTHLVINGTGIVDMAGHEIDFTTLGPNNLLYGRITVGDGVTLHDGGTSTVPTIKATGKGDGNVVLGACTFDECGPALEYTGTSTDDGYVTAGAFVVNANSKATQDSALATSIPQIKQSLDGNSNYPSTYSGFKILKGRIQLDNVSHVTVAGRLSGLRCGVHFTGTSGKQCYIGNLYSHCTVTVNTWADVANLELTSNTGININGPVLLRGGQWVVHSLAGTSLDSNVVVSEGYSHSYIDIVGHASLNTTVEQVILLPGHEDAAMVPANHIGKIRVRGNAARVFLKRLTFISKIGETFDVGPVAIDEGQDLAELTSCIFYKTQCDRATADFDGAVTPCSSGEAHQTCAGSPPRFVGDENRVTLGDFNMDYQGVSTGADTYATYLVGQVSGTIGANDLASVDPTFAGGGTYTWDEAAILAGTDSVEDVWTEIRAAFTPNNSALDGTGYLGVDVGAVDYEAAASGNRRRRLIMAA